MIFYADNNNNLVLGRLVHMAVWTLPLYKDVEHFT